MNSRRLSDRLSRLERQLAPTTHPLNILIEYIAPGGEVTSTLTIALGKQVDSAGNRDRRWNGDSRGRRFQLAQGGI